MVPVTLCIVVPFILSSSGCILPRELRWFKEVWGTAAKSKLEILDRLQNKALVSIPPNLYAELGIQPLSHRRRVAGLTVFKTIQCSLLPHPLDSLKLPLQIARRSTRQSCTQHPNTVIIPKSRTSQHQRSFISSCARLWNSLPASVVVAQSAQSFKSRIHNMLMNMPPAHNL